MNNILWKLSIILLIPSIILTLIIYRPIKWLITGCYYPKETNKTILSKWINKVI